MLSNAVFSAHKVTKYIGDFFYIRVNGLSVKI